MKPIRKFIVVLALLLAVALLPIFARADTVPVLDENTPYSSNMTEEDAQPTAEEAAAWRAQQLEQMGYASEEETAVSSDGYLAQIVENQNTLIGISCGIVAFIGILYGTILLTILWGRFKSV